MFKVTGGVELQDHIKKMSNPEKVFDPDFKTVATYGIGDIKKESPKMTGNFARAWKGATKVADSHYQLTNDVNTETGIPLAIILDQGRGEIRPVNAKMLKIPLSNKGRAGGGEFGIDFIFAKSAKAVKATYFMTNAIEKHGKMLADMMLKTIQRVHNGQ
jgi:hypothetical protein